MPYVSQLLAGWSFRLARDQQCALVTAQHVEEAYAGLRQEKPDLF
jgi:hypothetical protein